MISLEIAKKMRDLRAKFGLTQYELSKKVLVSDSYIAHIEMGRKVPSLEFAFRIEKALDLKAGEFSERIIEFARESAELVLN